MALSDYERQMLEELEAQLADEDPTFAKTMEPEPVSVRRHEFSLRHLVIGLVVAAAGIGVLVAGVAANLVVVGVAGVAVMFAGFWYVGTGIGEVSVESVGIAKGTGEGGARSFMDRQTEKWNRRQGGD